MIRHAIRRIRFSRLLAKSDSIPLRRLFDLWSSSDAIYLGPVGFGATLRPEASAIDRAAGDSGISTEELVEGTRHRDPKIAAACIEVLFRRGGRERVDSLVRIRSEKIMTRLGCHSIEMTIAEFVRSKEEQKAAQPADTAQRL